MPCEQNQFLGAYFDGELSPETARGVARHVAQCADCAAELNGLRAVAKLMSAARSSGMGEPSQMTMARLRRHVEGLVESADNGLLWLARVFSGVAASVLIGGLWLLNQAPTPAVGSTNWERVAVTLSFDTSPKAAPDLKLPESVLADLAGNGFTYGGLTDGDAAEVELP